MTETSVRAQIKRLVELQTIDFELFSFKRELKEKPDIIAQLQTKFESNQSRLKKLEDNFKVSVLDRKAKELELQAKEAEIIKANTQLSALKTNKEYQAKLNEIAHHKADNSVMEEKILILFDEADVINAQIVKEKNQLAEEEKVFLSQKKAIDESIKEIQDKMQLLNTKRRQIIPDINPGHLSRYERILENKDGLALVPIKSHCCGGCFMNIPDQMINEIRMNDRFISCEMCARMLYLEDEL